MVHNGSMAASKSVVRQSISLPASVAKQVKTLADKRKLSANRILVELVEDGLEAQKRKQEQFFALAEQFRSSKDPKEVERLGDELGRMVFGS
jgi:hypothetical protein